MAPWIKVGDRVRGETPEAPVTAEEGVVIPVTRKRSRENLPSGARASAFCLRVRTDDGRRVWLRELSAEKLDATGTGEASWAARPGRGSSG